MKAWNDFWYSPVAAVRPYLFFRGFLILLAADVWVLRIPKAAMYGTGGFNVSHFRWLDAVQPLPTAGLYVGVIALAGGLALMLGLTGVSRIGLGLLCFLYTYGWSMSLIDSFQHHYLISLLLLCLTCFPEVAAGDLQEVKDGRVQPSLIGAWAYKLLVVTVAIVYAYTAVTKMESGWRSGEVVQLLAEGSGFDQPVSALVQPIGISTAVAWKAFAIGTIVAELLLPLAYLLAVRSDERRSRWRQIVLFAAWCLAIALHVGIEQLDMRIGWFSAYMIYGNCVILLPAAWLSKLTTVITWPARKLMSAFVLLKSKISPTQLRTASMVITCAVAAGAVALGLLIDLPGMPVVGVIVAVSLVCRMLYGLSQEPTVGLGQVVATGVACVALWGVLAWGTGRFDYYSKRGKDLQWLQQIPEALIAYESALKYANRVEAPALASLHLSMASAYHAQNDQEQALQHIQQTLEVDPNSAEAHYGLGLSLASQGRLDDAIEELERGVELEPDLIEAQKDLGRIYLMRGKISQATDHLRLALETYPDYVEAHYYLGEAMRKKKDDSRAAAHFEDALQVDPEYAQARVALAELLQQQGRLPEAVAQYRRALQIIPDAASSSSALRRHVVLLRAATDLAWIEATSSESAVRDGKEALTWALQAAEATGYQSPKVLDVLAAAYAATDNFNEAVRFQKRALQVAPVNLKREFDARLELYQSRKRFEVSAPGTSEAESAEASNR